MKTGYTIVAIMLMLVTIGCSTQKITSSWKNEQVETPDFKKILVLALVKDEERALQQALENHIADDLQKLGYNAVSAYKTYGPKAFEEANERAALQQLNDGNIDVVLTVVLLNKKKENYYTPAHIYYSPYGFYHGRFWPYHMTLYRRIYEPGYYVTDTKYFWESNLYDAKTQHLLYSAQTNSFDFSSYNQLAHQYGKAIVADMLRKHLLIKPNY